VCLELALASCIPCLIGAPLHGAAAPTRVRATTIISYLVIQFSSSSVQSTLPNCAGDINGENCVVHYAQNKWSKLCIGAQGEGVRESGAQNEQGSRRFLL
jgi:hypothetical protein